MRKGLHAGVMELVAMELKQAGFFLARTLSYEVLVLHSATLQAAQTVFIPNLRRHHTGSHTTATVFLRRLTAILVSCRG